MHLRNAVKLQLFSRSGFGVLLLISQLLHIALCKKNLRFEIKSFDELLKFLILDFKMNKRSTTFENCKV